MSISNSANGIGKFTANRQGFECGAKNKIPAPQYPRINWISNFKAIYRKKPRKIALKY